MKKVLLFIINSFKSKTKSTKYSYDILIYSIFCMLYFILCTLINYLDQVGFDLFNLGTILATIFILFIYQTITLVFRLIEIKNNRYDFKFLNGKCHFKNESVDIQYKELKKILTKTTGGFKLYCKSEDYHIIYVKVFREKRTGELLRKYYLDKIEFDFGDFLMQLNQKKVLKDSKLTILGNNINLKQNKQFIKHLIHIYY